MDALELHTWMNKPSSISADAPPLKAELDALRRKLGQRKLTRRSTLHSSLMVERAAAIRAESEGVCSRTAPGAPASSCALRSRCNGRVAALDPLSEQPKSGLSS